MNVASKKCLRKVASFCVVSLVGFLLTACGSSTEENATKFYRLPALERLSTLENRQSANLAAKTNLKKRLVIDNVILADHLSNVNLTFQTTDVNYTLAENHLWISPLSQQLQLDLVNHLDQKLPNWYVTAMPLTDRTARLTVNIQDFHPRYDGKVVVSGQFLIQFTQGNRIISAPFNLIAPQNQDGYDASLRVLYELWSKQIDIIASQF